MVLTKKPRFSVFDGRPNGTKTNTW